MFILLCYLLLKNYCNSHSLNDEPISVFTEGRVRCTAAGELPLTNANSHLDLLSALEIYDSVFPPCARWAKEEKTPAFVCV